MNYKAKTKDELIKIISRLENKITDYEDELPSYEQLNERYDQGFDEGYRQGKNKLGEYISNAELSDMPNVLRFG